MRTIFIVFNDNPKKYNKLYCFNTDSNVEVGDKLKSPNYESVMTVVEVLNKLYTYFNKQTGVLSDEITSTSEFPILELKVGERDNSIVYATKL